MREQDGKNDRMQQEYRNIPRAVQKHDAMENDNDKNIEKNRPVSHHYEASSANQSKDRTDRRIRSIPLAIRLDGLLIEDGCERDGRSSADQ